MEFRPQDVSQLVLGYLKESKCKKAFVEFLNTSVHLREHAANYRRRQYFITRVSGLSLVDYLNEYALIYTIVQERLEASEFFKENQCRSSLVNQLLYLLDKLEIQSRTSTPINQETMTNGNFFREDIINNLDEIGSGTDHVSFDRVTNKVNNTPFNRSLNTSVRECSSLNNSKSKTLTPTADKSTTTEDETDGKDKSHEECEEIFTNTFLENVELIEKLADNINKEVSSKSNAELDSTAIKSIVQRTEADPIFVQLLNELIETPNEKNKCLDVLMPDLSKSSSSDRPKEVSTKKSSTPSNETNIKRRLRSSKSQPMLQSNVNSIDEQNNDAVKLICMHAASLSSEPANLTPKNSTLISTELVLSTEQSINIPQSLYTTPSAQNTMLTNAGSLLMLQPSTSIATSNILPQKTLTLDTSKPCYLIGNQPLVSVSVPPAPLKIPNLVSEQDILSMPTIFVCDTSQQLSNAQTVVVPSNVPANVIGPPRYQNIAPKHTPEKVQSLSEFITLYKCNDTMASPRISSPHGSSPPKLIPLHSRPPLNKNPLQIITENPCVSIEPETTNNNESNSDISKKTESVPVPLSSSLELKLESSQVKVVEKKEKLNRTTPKGSSHIRQLDFSTPEKWIPLPLTESSSKPKKSVNSKSVRTTMFKSPNEEITNEENENDEKKNDESKKTPDKSSGASKPAWDANLRGFQVSKSPIMSTQEKSSKRKRLEDSIKQIPNTKKLKESFSKTDENACNKPTVINEEIVNQNSSNLNTSTTSSNKKSKSAEKRLDKSTSKKKEKKRKSTEATSDGDLASSKTNSTNEEKIDSVNNQLQVEKPFGMINRNLNTKIRKKCNTDNAKKFLTNNEVVLTSVPKIKSLEVLNENKNTLILSPSKLNANKRTLMEIENHAVTEQNLVKPPVDFKSSTNTDNKNDSITEEFVDSLPKINSLPLLQTPVKVDVMQIPKTPGINLSTTIETPFTKAVIDQLNGVDINSIPTPKFPITPHFALTPALAHSPFSNRGTDYSTSSSYYQPSDTEQNKSLEQLIQECQRLEKQEIFLNNPEHLDKTTPVENQKLDELEHSTASLDTVVHVASTNVDIETSVKIESTCNKPNESIHNMLAEKQKAFNESLSGKKNMQLVKMLSEAAQNDSDSDWVSSKEDSSSSNDDTTSSSCSCIISPIKEKTSPYSLRPRKTVATNDSKDEKMTSKNRNSKSPEPIIKDEKPLITHKADVLQKMEAIRQRTIAKFKDNDSAPKQKSSTSARSLSKLRKDSFKLSTELFPKVQKPNEKLNENELLTNIKNVENTKESKLNVSGKNSNKKGNSLSKEKSKSGKKKISKKVKSFQSSLTSAKSKSAKGKPESKSSVENKTLVAVSSKLANKEDVTMAVDEEDIVLHLSSDDENLEPFEIVETELLECSASSTPLSENLKEYNVNNEHKNEENIEKNVDKEAETLVKELKQWGIHLIPNKSSKNKVTADVKDIKDIKSEENKPVNSKKLTNVEEKKNLKECENKEIKMNVEEIKKKNTPLKDEKKVGETKNTSQSNKKNSPRSKIYKTLTWCECVGNKPKPLETVKNKLYEVKGKQVVEEVMNKSTREVKEKQVVRSSERKSSIEEQSKGNKPKLPETVKNKLLCEVKEKQVVRSSERKSSVEDNCKGNISKSPESVKNKSSVEVKEKQVVRTSERKVSVEKQSEENKSKPAEAVKNKSLVEVREKQVVKSSERKVSIEKQSEENKSKPAEAVKNKSLVGVREKQVVKSNERKVSIEKQSEENKSKPVETVENKSLREVKENQVVRSSERKSLVEEQIEDNKPKPPETVRNEPSCEVKEKPVVRSSERRISVEEQSSLNKSKTSETIKNKSSDDVKEKQSIRSSERKSSIDEGKRLSINKVDNTTDFQIQFDIETIAEETIKIKHDYNTVPRRKLSDYNLDILTKTFSANVFIDEMDSTVEKFLSFTRFKFLLDIPQKSSHKKIEKVKDNDEPLNSQAKKKKPLNILYNQLIKEPVDIHNQSPLDNLYASDSASREKFAVRKSILGSNAKSERSERIRSKRFLSIDKSGPSKDDQNLVETDRNTESRCPKFQESQNQDLLKFNDYIDKDIESAKQDSVTDSENDLMNYALIGSERVENSEEEIIPSPDKRKRKPSDDISIENKDEKKKKTEECQELLRNIDVDSFLKQLHGDM